MQGSAGTMQVKQVTFSGYARAGARTGLTTGSYGRINTGKGVIDMLADILLLALIAALDDGKRTPEQKALNDFLLFEEMTKEEDGEEDR